MKTTPRYSKQMPKRFTLKIHPTESMKVGDANFQAVEVGEGKFCIVSVPRLCESEIEALRDTWQNIVGDEVGLVVVNYEFDLNTVEVVEVDPPTRYEREPVI